MFLGATGRVGLEMPGGSLGVMLLSGEFCQEMLGLNNFLPTNGFSIKPLKVELLAGEQKPTELVTGEHVLIIGLLCGWPVPHDSTL